MHDAVELEARGVRTVVIHTTAFLDAARAHALTYGRPDFAGSVAVRHPIAALSREDVSARADEVIPAIIAALLGQASTR
jgi:hypothetical protein